MAVLEIGKTKIAYSLRRSPTAKRARLTVTPHSVEVVAPESASDEQIARVLKRREEWIVSTTRQMAQKAKSRPSVVHFATGAKLPYRGRQTRLHVEMADCQFVEVEYRNGFRIRVPRTLPPDVRDWEIETALRLWLRRRLRSDVLEFIRRHGEPNDLRPHDVRIKNLKHLWGSCGRDRVLNFNWHLVFAPKPILEYVVVHELVHLRYRNHQPTFWRAVGRLLPDWESRKEWLDRNEHLFAMAKLDRS